MSRIFWDTNIFIYFFEADVHFGPPARALRQRMVKRGDQLITSAMTLGEIMVKPLQQGDLGTAVRYETAIKNVASVLSFDLEAARHYSHLRQYRSLKAPDALQLASAAAAKVDLFITNDNRLRDLHVPGIHFIVPIDRAPI